MVELIAGLAIALMGLAGAYMAKTKKSARTEEKLEREKAVLKEAVNIQEIVRRRAADPDERERVRAKYTRKGNSGDEDMLSDVPSDKHVSGGHNSDNGANH